MNINLIITLFLSLLLSNGITQAKTVDASEEELYLYGDLYYRIISVDDKTVSVTKGEYPYCNVTYKIPPSINIEGVSYTVTQVDDETFMSSSHIRVLLPNTIKCIGDKAFAAQKEVYIYSTIIDATNVELGKDVFGTSSETERRIYVLMENMDSYTRTSKWSQNCDIFGCVNYDGITYTLYQEDDENNTNRASIVELYMGASEQFPDTEFSIPNAIQYGGEQYKINKGFTILNPDNCAWGNIVEKLTCNIDLYVGDLPKLAELIYDCPITFFISVQNCKNLHSIEFKYPISRYLSSISSNPKLKEIRFDDDILELYCDNSSPFFESNDDVDIYLNNIIPPKFASWSGTTSDDHQPNPIVRIHIPQGSEEAYRDAGWQNFNLIPETSAKPLNVELGNNGNEWLSSSGYDCNSQDVAFRLPSNILRSYIGAEITQLKFFCSFGMNVEYVFIAKKDSHFGEYIEKIPVNCIDNSFIIAPLKEPYVINGEDIFIGVGSVGRLSIPTICSFLPQEGLWMRQQEIGCLPTEFFETPLAMYWILPLTCIVKGESLPVDAAIISIESIGQEQNANPDPLQLPNETMAVKAINTSGIATSALRIKVQNRTPETIKNFRIRASDNGVQVIDTLVKRTLLTNQSVEMILNVPIVDNTIADHILSIDIPEIDGNLDGVPDNSYRDIAITIEPSTINSIISDKNNKIKAIYNLQGIKLTSPRKGEINIVLFSNGQRKLIRY